MVTTEVVSIDMMYSVMSYKNKVKKVLTPELLTKDIEMYSTILLISCVGRIPTCDDKYTCKYSACPKPTRFHTKTQV